MTDREYMHSVRRLFTTNDGIDPNEYVIVRYRIQASPDLDVRAAAVRLALVASIGTVSPMAIEDAQRREAVGPRVLHPGRPTDERAGEVAIAFPLPLFAGADPLAQLMSIVMFGGEYNYVSEIRLESIDLPRALLDTIAGPSFGRDGLRSRLGVVERPVVGAILKPRLGVTLQTLAHAAEEAFLGGADLIMDDELVVDPLGDQAFLPRVTALVAAARSAQRATGEKKSVIVNVTARPSNTSKYAELALELGADGLLLNGFVCGFPAFQDLADAGWGLPLFACNVGSGLLTRSASGVASSVYARLSRLAGSDAVQTGILAGDAYTTEAWGPAIIALDRELGKVKPAVPIVAGGLNVANLWRNWRSLGNDVVFAAGSGIFGYPSGPRAGASDLRKVLENLSSEMSAKEASAGIVRLAQKKGSTMAQGLESFGFDPELLMKVEQE